MTDEKSIEERLEDHASARRPPHQWDSPLAADLEEAAAELRRLREDREALYELERQVHANETPVRRQLREETARRESAEALLRDRLSELPDGGWVAAEEHFERYMSTGSGETKEAGR